MANLPRELLIASQIKKQWKLVSYVDLKDEMAKLSDAEIQLVLTSLMNGDSAAKDLMDSKFNARFSAQAELIATQYEATGSVAYPELLNDILDNL